MKLHVKAINTLEYIRNIHYKFCDEINDTAHRMTISNTRFNQTVN